MASRVMSKVTRKGTPFSRTDSLFSVLTYNCLAPIYVRPLDARTGTVQAFAAFPWAEPADEVLSWEARWPRILSEIRDAQVDVIALQELQFEPEQVETPESCVAPIYKLPTWLDPLLQNGYRAHYADQAGLRQIAERNERVLGRSIPVGNAILYRSDRLELCPNTSGLQSSEPVPPTSNSGLGAEALSYANPKKAKKQGVKNSGTAPGVMKDTTTRVGVCVKGKGGSALEHLLGPTAVFSVHLDATSEEQRVKQLTKCLSHARFMGTRQVVIAGDCNSEFHRGSCVEGFLADDPPNKSPLHPYLPPPSPLLRNKTSDPTSHAELATKHNQFLPSDEELARECASALRLTSSEGSSENGGALSSTSSEAASQVSALASARPSPEQMASWVALREEAASATRRHRIPLRRAPSGATRAAYDHGRDHGPCVTWCLDHILYSSSIHGVGPGSGAGGASEDGGKPPLPPPPMGSSGGGPGLGPGLVCTEVWEGLEADPTAAAAGTPNRTCPSDHLPVACSFACSPTPTPSAADRERLIQQWQGLQAKHAKELAALASSHEVEEASVRASELDSVPAAPSPEASSSPENAHGKPAPTNQAAEGPPHSNDQATMKKKKKKTANARPSDAVVALKGQQRRQRQALVAKHEAERVAAAGKFILSESERDLAEELGLFGLEVPKS